MRNLKDFGNHWKAIPYAMSVLVSGDAFLILFHLSRKSKGFMSDEPVFLSKKKIAKLIGKSRNSLDKPISELKGLGLIFEETIDNGKTSVFKINWEEIHKIHSISSRITDCGWEVLRDYCRKSGYIPVSMLNEQTCSEIEQVYGFNKQTCSEIEQVGETCPEIEQVYTNTQQTCSEIEQVSQREDQTCSEIGQVITQTCSEIEQVFISDSMTCSEIEQVVQQTCSEIEQVGGKLKVIIENMGNFNKNHENVVNHFDKITNLLSKTCSEIEQVCEKTCSVFEQVGVQTCSVFEHQYKRYNRDNKRDLGKVKENFLQTIKNDFSSSKNNFWNEFRDLSFPAYSNEEFQGIINHPDFYNSNSDKLIREVWQDLNSILETDEEQEEETNELPVSCFYSKVLWPVWNELKEQDSDFDITEEQAKNIFGFQVLNHDSESFFVISSSSIKNINPVLDEQPKQKEIISSHSDDRLSRELFKESLLETATLSLDELTNIEYAIFLLDDFVEARREKGIPREDEITAIQFSDLLSNVSKDSGVSVEDLENLTRIFKKKKNSSQVHIRISAIDVSKVLQYNSSHGEKSSVEDLWNKKLTQYNQQQPSA